MPAATVTSKGQITIPVEVRSELGIRTGDRVEFVSIGEKQFAIVPATLSIRELKGILRNKRKRIVTIEEMNAAIVKRGSHAR